MQMRITIDHADADSMNPARLAEIIRTIADRIEGCSRTDDLFDLGYFYTNGTAHRSITDPGGNPIGEVSLNPD